MSMSMSAFDAEGAAMATRAGERTETDATVEEDDAAFWARAASYGFVRPDEIDPDQAWFWTREWIAGEIEVELAIREGRMTYHDSDEEFLAALERASADADAR
jgi:hypothetical protein